MPFNHTKLLNSYRDLAEVLVRVSLPYLKSSFEWNYLNARVSVYWQSIEYVDGRNRQYKYYYSENINLSVTMKPLEQFCDKIKKGMVSFTKIKERDL